MQGVYIATEEITALNPTAGDTLLLLEAPGDAVLELLSCRLTNSSVDTSEQLEWGLFRVGTKGSPAGNSITPEKTEDGSVASGATVLGAGNAGLTTEPTSYNSEPLMQDGMNNLGGGEEDLVPEDRIYISPSGLVGIRLMAAPSAAFNAHVTMKWREIGG